MNLQNLMSLFVGILHTSLAIILVIEAAFVPLIWVKPLVLIPATASMAIGLMNFAALRWEE